jgi:hypothetical protein
MRRSFLIFTLSIILFGSCFEDEAGMASELVAPCGVYNPVENLEWLSNSIAQLEESRNSEMYPFYYVSQALYNGRVVFIFGNCCPYCNTTVPVLDCGGEFLFNRFEQGKTHIFSDETVIWQAVGSKCNFI